MKFATKFVSALIAGHLAMVGQGIAADKLPGEGKTVRTAVSVDETRFGQEVVNLGLEQLGYTVGPIAMLGVQAGYVALSQGDLDVWGEFWWPDHESYLQKVGGEKTITTVGTLVKGGWGAYVIDKKTADEYKITNIGQLADPKLAKLFDTDGDGKADLAGCPVGWGCDPITVHHMEAFKLTDTVKNDQGDFVVTHSDVVAREKAGKPVFYYTYAPLWLNQILKPGVDVTLLEVPFTTFPDGRKAKTPTTVDGKNVGFESFSIKLAVNNKFLEENPAARKFFELASIPVADVDAENLKMFQGEKSYEDIQRHAKDWVAANQATFDGWVAQAKAAAK